MNKIKFIATWVAMVMALLVSNTSYAGEAEDFLYTPEAGEVIQERMDLLGSDIEFKVTPEVKKLIRLYLGRHKYGSELLIGRSGIYFPLIEQRINEMKLPSELKFIPIIESSLKPYARSRVGAAGLWQFMRPTGRMMGLKISSVVDERNDPIKSTHAALDYLEMLYDQFDDWTLAIAAYNCGPGNVRKAIRRSGSRDFWKLIKHLPKETQMYVPKFIATAYVMSYYIEHGLNPITAELDENPTTAKVYETVSFKKIANDLEMEYKDIKKMNPSYLKGYIPKSDKGHHLTLPEHKLLQLSFTLENPIEVVYQPIERKPVVETIAEEVEKEEAVIQFTREIYYIPVLEYSGDSFAVSSKSSISGDSTDDKENESKGNREKNTVKIITVLDRKQVKDNTYHNKHIAPKINLVDWHEISIE